MSLNNMKLYYHKTDGGAEYLMDTFMEWEHNGKKGKEGIFKGANFVVRIDGDITKDAELMIGDNAMEAYQKSIASENIPF